MSGIVEELRQCAHFRVMTPKLLYKAADEIVRLQMLVAFLDHNDVGVWAAVEAEAGDDD